METLRIEDLGKLENESRDIEDGQLLNNGMKDDRITVTGDCDDLPVSTWAIHFACWPVNGIGRGQHGSAVGRLQSRILDDSLCFDWPVRTCSAWGKWCTHYTYSTLLELWVHKGCKHKPYDGKRCTRMCYEVTHLHLAKSTSFSLNMRNAWICELLYCLKALVLLYSSCEVTSSCTL